MWKKNLYRMTGQVTPNGDLGYSPSNSPKLSFGRSVKESRQIALQTYYSTNPEVSPGPIRRDSVFADGSNRIFTSLKEINKKIRNQMSVTGRNWPRRFALLLTCFSASVGLGNVWRFPKVAVEHGAGSFLIAYVIVVVLIAQPLHFLELCIGQFSSKGSLKVWRCFPVFRGLGYSQLVITFYLALNLGIVMAWSLFYVTETFRTKLPWKPDSTAYPTWSPYSTDGANQTNYTVVSSLNSTIEHWKSCILQDKNPDSAVLSNINWKLAVFLIGIWVTVFLCLLPGIKSLRKMTYVTCVPPFICLTAMIIYLLVSKASPENIRNLLDMLKPDWNHLKDLKVWYAACQQAFISLNLAFGQLILFSSFNEFKHSVLRDSVIICIFDTVASLLSACAVFAVVGKNDSEEILKATGFGIAFVAYAAGIGRIKRIPQLWICLFFLMILFLGLGNVVSLMTSLLYVFDQNDRWWKWRRTISFGLCCSCCALGLLFTTDVSLEVLTALDYYGISFCVVLLAVLETIGITWGYGIKRLSKDIGFMFHSPLLLYWKINWAAFTPLCLTAILIYCYVLRGIDWNPNMASWPFILGWTSAAVTLVFIPIGAVISYKKVVGYGFRNKLRAIFHDDQTWGPNDPIDLRNWKVNKDAQKSASSSKRSTPRVKHKVQMNGGIQEGSSTATPHVSPPVTRNTAYDNEAFDVEEHRM